MTTTSAYRVAGGALMLGSVAFVLGILAGSAPPPAVVPLAHALILLFVLFTLVGLPALYLRQRREAGAMALAGTACIYVAILLLGGFNYIAALLVPALALTAPEVLASFPGGEWQALVVTQSVARIGIALGFVLLGIASYRAAVLPRLTAVIAIVGGFTPIVQLAGFMLDLPRAIGAVAVFVMALGFFALGWGLWSSVVPETERVPARGDAARPA